MIVLFLSVVTGAENFDIFPCEMVREGAAASIIFLAIQGTSVQVLIISIIFLVVQGTSVQVLIISIIFLVVQGTSVQVLIISIVRYHCGGSMELNARILLLAYMVYL
jgi:hypothetical protein